MEREKPVAQLPFQGTEESRPPSASAPRYDLVIIGGGKGVEAAAREASQRGLQVGLVRKPDASPDLAELRTLDYALRQAARHARRTEFLPSPDGADLLGGLCATQQAIAPTDSQATLAAAGVQTLVGQPAFAGPDMLRIGEHRVRFRRAILAGWLRWAPTTVEVLSEEVEELTTETLAHLDRLPRRLAILGTGPRACIWAQAFCRLGSTVCLAGREMSLLPGEEPFMAAAVRERLAAEGVQLQLGCGRLIVDRIGTQKVLVLERQGVKEKRLLDRIFWERPLEPDLDGLHLEAAGVACSSGAVQVNDRLQTTNRRILAIGPICGKPFASPETIEAMARLAVDNVFRLFPRRFHRAQVPRSTWTDPEIARVGWTPAEAAPCSIELVTYRADHRDWAVALPGGCGEGCAWVHVARGTGRVVGAAIVGQQAAELAGTIALLIASRISLAAVAEVVPCRPTHFELLEHIARLYREDRLRSRWPLLLHSVQTPWRRLVQRVSDWRRPL